MPRMTRRLQFVFQCVKCGVVAALKSATSGYVKPPLTALLACLAAAALFAADASAQSDPAADRPPAKTIAQAPMKSESLAVEASSGAKVCRTLQVGIAVRDVVRGEVTAANVDRVSVRIDNAGRHPHMIGDRLLVKGMVIDSAAADWGPCP
jgi:hypothetical protein